MQDLIATLQANAPWAVFLNVMLNQGGLAFDKLKDSPVRLVLSAVDVETGQLAIFDSYVDDITPDHILASESLPPGFPRDDHTRQALLGWRIGQQLAPRSSG